MANEKILNTELQNWYTTVNSVATNYGGGITTLTTPTANKKAEATDINNLVTKITQFKNDSYLGTQPQLYNDLPTSVAAGAYIQQNLQSGMVTTIENLSLIKCRNAATNNNTCYQQYTVAAYGTNNYTAAYGTNNFVPGSGTNNYTAAYGCNNCSEGGCYNTYCSEGGCFNCYVADTCSNNGCYVSAGYFTCYGYGSYYCSNCYNIQCSDYYYNSYCGDYHAASGCTNYKAPSGCTNYHAATGCTNYHAAYTAYHTAACSFGTTIDILCANTTWPR